jgi:ABC-type transport system involved in multi-copper enzyme maturation permease subunit
MMHIIETEWLKIKSYRAFWWVMGITALSYPGINYIFYNAYKEITKKGSSTSEMAKMLLGNPFEFPETFHTAGYFSSFFIFIPSIVVIMMITNEYTYKTHRQNIIDGWSRHEFLMAKLLDVLFITLMVTVLYFVVSLFIGFASTKSPVQDIFSKSSYIGLFSLQTFSQLSIAFLIGFLVRKSFIALSIFIFYYLIFENTAVNILKLKANDIGRFLPLEISDRLIPIPAFLGKFNEATYKKSLDAIGPHFWYTLLVTAIIWVVCYWINKKRDL